MKSTQKSFVKLPGPINLNDDSSDEEEETKQKISSILKHQTPKSSKKINSTPNKTPKTEVELSSISMSPKNLVTPKRKTQKEMNSSFTPLSPVPTPKQQVDKMLSTSVIQHDEKTNYSRILKNKSPVFARNTHESSIGETYRRIYRENRSENQKLLHQKNQLEIKYRRIKLENKQLLAKQREENIKGANKIPEEIERKKRKVENAENKLKSLQNEQESNEKFIEISRIHEKVNAEKQQINETNNVLKVLNSIMAYSVKEYDIENIINMNEFNGEVGEKMKELLCEFKKVIPVLDIDIE